MAYKEQPQLRVVREFYWGEYFNPIGAIRNPPAMLREEWLRRGFCELIGDESACEKKAAAKEVKPKKHRKRRSAAMKAQRA